MKVVGEPIILLTDVESDFDPNSTTASIGFLTRDPIGYVDSRNLYQALLWNPLVKMDAMGLRCTPNWADDGVCSIAKFISWYLREESELSSWLPMIKPCPCKLACTVKFKCFKPCATGPNQWTDKAINYVNCPSPPPGFESEGHDWFGYHPGSIRRFRTKASGRLKPTCRVGVSA